MGCGASQNRQIAMDIDARVWGGIIKIRPKRGALEKDVQILGKQDPYVQVNIGQQQFKSTVSEDGGCMPEWKDEIEITRTNEDDLIVLSIWNKNILIHDEFLGQGALALTGVKESLNPVDRNVILYRHGKRNGELIVELKYELDPQYVSNPEVLAPNTKGQIKVYPIQALLTKDCKLFGTMSPIITCRFGDDCQSSTVSTDGGKNPKWQDCLIFDRDVKDECVMVECWNFSEMGSNDFMGAGFFSITPFLPEPNQRVKKSVNLIYDNQTVGTVTFQCEFLTDEPQSYKMDYERKKQELLQRIQNKDKIGASNNSSSAPAVVPEQTYGQPSQPPPQQQQQQQQFNPPPQQPFQQPQQQGFQQQGFQQQGFQQPPQQGFQQPFQQQQFPQQQQPQVIIIQQQPGYNPYMNTPPAHPPPPTNGNANYTYINGDVYNGNFFNSLRHGQGRCIYKNGTIYTGEWNNDQYHGNGNITVGDFSYVGEFKYGKKDGKGVGTWTNGTQYDGDWSNNQMHGMGFYTMNGKARKAQFENGQRTKWLDESTGLMGGKVLNYNVQLPSDNGLFAFVLAFDGSLCVLNRTTNQVLFKIAQYSRGNLIPPFYLKLEHNGSLVAYDATLVPYWTSVPVFGIPPFRLRMGDDGKATIHDAVNPNPLLYLN